MRTYKLELRADFQDSEKYDALLHLFRASARELLTSALLLKDKREPVIALSTGDMMAKDENMEILTPADLEDENARGEVTKDGNWGE